MMFHRLGLITRNQRGITVIELIIAMPAGMEITII